MSTNPRTLDTALETGTRLASTFNEGDAMKPDMFACFPPSKQLAKVFPLTRECCLPDCKEIDHKRACIRREHYSASTSRRSARSTALAISLSISSRPFIFPSASPRPLPAAKPLFSPSMNMQYEHSTT